MTLLWLLLLISMPFSLPTIISLRKKDLHMLNSIIEQMYHSVRLVIIDLIVFTYWQSNARLHHPMIVTIIDFCAYYRFSQKESMPKSFIA